MEWFSTLTLALGSAWTSGINLYATVTVLGLLQKFGLSNLPGGLDALDNWCCRISLRGRIRRRQSIIFS